MSRFLKLGCLIGACVIVVFAAWYADRFISEQRLNAVTLVTPQEKEKIRLIENTSQGLVISVVDLEYLDQAGVLPLETTTIGTATPADLRLGSTVFSGVGVRHTWPSIYSSARFDGSYVVVAFSDEVNRYRVTLDGPEAAELIVSAPGDAGILIGGLKKGSYFIRVDKISESFDLSGIFWGFFTSGDGVQPAPENQARTIEFIGDSDTVGYGNLSASRGCEGNDPFFLTDTTASFGPTVARHFNADYQTIAQSGIGLMDRSNSGKTIASLYAGKRAEELAYTGADGWQPQIVVVTIGSNDFSPQHPNSSTDIRSTFENLYLKFLSDLRGAYPDATFILMSIENFGKDYLQAHRSIMQRLNSVGDSPILLLELPPIKAAGCHWHPSGEDHGNIAAVLIDFIERTVDF